METILLQLLEVQKEILAELRLLRQAVTAKRPAAATATATAPSPAPQAVAPAAPPQPEAPAPEPAPQTTPSQQPRTQAAPQSGGMLTVDELADLGGQFLDQNPKRRARVKPVDASDLSSSILDEIKSKNRAKRSAFAEFDKFTRDR